MRVVIVLATVGIAGMAWKLFACTCVGSWDPRFLIDSGSVLPAQASGVPIINIIDPQGDVSMPRWQLSVERLDRRAPPVPFEIRTVASPLARSWTELKEKDRIALLCPHWEPGGTYRIKMGEKSLDVSLSPDSLRADACSLDIWESGAKDVRASTVSGSCSVTFPAYRVGIELAGQEITRWRSALLYVTVVDGAVWRPSENICRPTPLGKSWVGPSREMLYCECYGDRSSRPAPAEFVLTPGEHDVTMVAWLPGVTQVGASCTVTLECE